MGQRQVRHNMQYTGAISRIHLKWICRKSRTKQERILTRHYVRVYVVQYMHSRKEGGLKAVLMLAEFRIHLMSVRLAEHLFDTDVDTG